ncbi:MAG: hypothetical protein GXX10_07610 [Clostridiaceae bacterium]|nr:hypothetical protein [Clostridiaceae bacterium]
MVWVIEIIILFTLFTLMVVPAVIKNPLLMVHDYPTDIYEKAIELGLVKESHDRKSKKFIVISIITVILIGLIFGPLIYYFNGARNFLTGAGYTYILWTAVNWYDALILDCLWFCHSNKVVIPGTEGMAGYKDYMFHIKGAFKGMLLGIPSAIIAGIVVLVLK